MPARPPVDTLQSHLDAFRRHRGKAIAFFLTIAVAAVVLLAVMPGTYESEALLYVRLGRESVTLDAVATTGQTVNVSEGREFEINTVAEVLANDGLAGKVVETLGSDRLLKNDEGLEQLYEDQGVTGFVKLQVAKLLQSIQRSGRGTDQERAQKLIAAGRSVYPIPRSGLVKLSCTANTPELAQQVTSALIEEFLNRHVSMHRSSGSEDFFSKQTEILRAKLADAESQLAQLKNNTGVLTVEGARAHLQNQLDLIEQQRATVKAELAGAQSNASMLSKFAAETPDQVTTAETSGLPNVARDAMRQQLYQQEIDLQDMLSRLTESHPQVIAAKKKIEDSRAILESQTNERSQVVRGVSLVHQSVSLDSMRQLAEKSGFESKLASLDQQRNEVLDRIKTMNETETKILDLERQVDMLADTYLTYTDKLEQSRITAELEKGRISNVHVVRQPSISTRPSSPNKPLLLAGALLLGAIGAYLIVAVCELLDHRLHRPEDVEEYADIPVLSTLPRVARRYASLN